MASLHHHAAVLLTFGLLAGCGGDRTRARGGTDTTGAAAVSPDSAAMPMKDTTAAPAPDTATKPAPADTAKRPSAVAPARNPTTTTASADTGAKHVAAGKPKPMAKRDTSRVQTAESTKSAATPTPAPTAQQQTPAPTQQPAQQPAQPPAQAQDTSTQDTTQQAPLRDAYHQAPRDTVDQATYDGWKQFNLNCARCHGEDVLGTTIAPHLIMSLKPDGPINTKELFVQTVCAGRPAKGMPSWCALGLDMQKINDIYLYVKGRSDAKIAPGRPAVKSGG